MLSTWIDTPLKLRDAFADETPMPIAAFRGKRRNGKVAIPGEGEMSESSEAGSGKGRKRQAVKPASGRAASKVKCTIHLTIEASQRLDIHATMSGMDRSELVESLIQLHCRRWVVSDRGGADGAGGEAAA
jgi:hypothetical protein